MRSLLIRVLLYTACVLGARSAGAMNVTLHERHPVCDYPNGMAWATVTGGVAPYTFLWSNGAITDTIIGLPAGNYSCTVTDNVGTVVTRSTTLVMFGLDVPYSFSVSPSCGDCNGEITVDTVQLRGVAPYMITPTPSFYSGSVAHIIGLCPTLGMDLVISDVHGCQGGITDLPIGEPAIPLVNVPEIQPSCNGLPAGSALVEVSQAVGNAAMLTEITVSGPSGVVYQAFNTEMSGTLQLPLGGLVAGSYSVNGFMQTYCDPQPFNAPFDVPDLGLGCGTVSGEVFIDVDQDCVHDAGEPAVTGRVLTIAPGPAYAITDGNGHYARALDAGSYTIAQSSADLVQLCPPQQPVPFTLDNVTSTAVVDLADSSTIPFDLRVHCTMSQLYPGLPAGVWVGLTDLAAYSSGPIHVTLNFPPELTFVTADVAPTTVNAGELQWDLSALTAFGHTGIAVQFMTSNDLGLIGTLVEISAEATATTDEDDLSNNACSSVEEIRAAYDPNDKLARTSSNYSSTQYFLGTDGYVDYTVRFQNTGNAQAFNVIIRDTLEADLDIASLEILGASHVFLPALREGRELVFTFPDIHLSDSATDFIGSQGYVSYRIKPRAGIMAGDLLENTAAIHFDTNPAVITNTSVLAVDMSTGVTELDAAAIQLRPNPATDELTVTLPGSAMTGRVEVVGVDGRVVRVPMTFRGTNAVLDVRGLRAGVYVLRYAEGAMSYTRRFVKH